VSASDQTTVLGKGEVYKRHPDCVCVLFIHQDRCEASVELRTTGGWARQTLSGPMNRLVLPAFGLECALGDLYKGTVGLGGLSHSVAQSGLKFRP
jgi:hypothetical protein